MSNNRFVLGIKYDSKIELTELIPRDDQGKPLVNEKVYLDKTYVSYVDSGPIKVKQEDIYGNTQEREIRSDYGSDLGKLPYTAPSIPQDRVVTETGRRQVYTRGRAEDVDVSVSSDTPLGFRIAAISQTGTIVPQ
jgi:hypothetical protein